MMQVLWLIYGSLELLFKSFTLTWLFMSSLTSSLTGQMQVPWLKEQNACDFFDVTFIAFNGNTLQGVEGGGQGIGITCHLKEKNESTVLWYYILYFMVLYFQFYFSMSKIQLWWI